MRKMVGVAIGLVGFIGCHQAPAPIDSATFVTNAVIVQGEEPHIAKAMHDLGHLAYTLEPIDRSDGTYVVHYDRSDVSPLKLSEDLSHAPGIGFAEPNFRVRGFDAKPPKDKKWMYQWALANVGQDSPHGLPGKIGADIGALRAWEKTQGDKDIIVAIVDSGVDYLHPDLKDNIWVNAAELNGRERGITGVDDDGNGWVDDIYGWNFISNIRSKPYFGQLGDPDPMDDLGHGTHCAGIVGAKANNYEGISGIAWKVRLMALKVLDSEGYGKMDDVARALRYAIANRVDIVSMSFGTRGRSKLLEQALKKTESAGILAVVSAGNDGANNDTEDVYPGNFGLSNVVVVAASDNRDRLARFSNYGPTRVHIAAPGVDIVSTIPSDGNPTTQDYEAYSGTSMAAPMVSGAAALLLSARPELRKKPADVRTALMASVDRTQELEVTIASGGRLNVDRLLSDKFNVALDEKTFETVTEPLTTVQSPKYPQWYPAEMIDHIWTVSRLGAQKIRVYFAEWGIDALFDLLAVYSKSYELVTSYRSESEYGVWTPWVSGDTIKIRFANSLVMVVQESWREFGNAKEATEAGAYHCQPIEDTYRVRCKIAEAEAPSFNHESEGFKVTQVEYIREKTTK